MKIDLLRRLFRIRLHEAKVPLRLFLAILENLDIVGFQIGYGTSLSVCSHQIKNYKPRSGPEYVFWRFRDI